MNKISVITVASLTLLLVGLGSIGYAAITLATINTTGNYQGTYTITINPTSFDWGTATIDDPITRTATIQNTGTKNVNSLTMEPINLNDITTDDFTLTWDLEGQTLDIGESKTATFTFTLTNDPGTTSYSFAIEVNEQ